MRYFPILMSGLALTLAACSPAPQQSAAPEPSSSTRAPEPAAATIEDRLPLFGQWDIVQVAGEDVSDADSYLLFGEDWWHFQSQCIWDDGDYRLDDGTLDFTAIERTFEPIEGQSRPMRLMCARGLSPAEQSVMGIMQGRQEMALTQDRLVISSPDGDIVAQRRSDAVLNPMQYTSVDPATTWGEWRVASLNGAGVENARVAFAQDWASIVVGCSTFLWHRAYKDSGESGLAPRIPFNSGCEADARATSIARTLGQPVSIRANGKGGRVVEGEGGTVVLTR
jgi:heat shock protein HslJ